jgi:hypothetical protein
MDKCTTLTANFFFQVKTQWDASQNVLRSWSNMNLQTNWNGWGQKTTITYYYNRSVAYKASSISVTKISVIFHSVSILLFFFHFLGLGWDCVHLVRRSLLGLFYRPRMMDNKCGAIGGMIGRRNRSTRRKPALVKLCSPKIPHALAGAQTRNAAVWGQQITAWTMAWSFGPLHQLILKLN